MPSISHQGKWISVEGYPSKFKANGDMSGTQSNFFNYWMQQQQQATDLELWNLQNEYNSPKNQMLRYQQAGLNPNLIYSQSNTASSPASSPSPIPAKATNFKAQNTLGALDSAGRIISGLNNVLGQVQQTYDYAKYGMQNSELRNRLLRNQIINTQLQGDALDRQNFVQKILAGEFGPVDKVFFDAHQGDGSVMRASDIPLIARYLNQNELVAEQVEKINKYLDEMFPVEKSYMESGTSLRRSEKEWNENIRGFVNSINTGIPWLDMLIKAIMRIAVGR